MTLEEARRRIDVLDREIRELMMRRMELSYAVAESKKASGDITVYRPEREKEILRTLGEDVPPERRDAYLAVVRKIMESSRKYQYGLLYDWLPGAAAELFAGLRLPADCAGVRLRLTRPNRPDSMAEILSMVGDAGCDMEEMELECYDAARENVTFALTVLCDLNRTDIKKLMFQISMESRDFEILEAFGRDGRTKEEENP